MNMEVNPHFANIVSPSEVVVVCPFHVEFEGGSGDVHVTMPYSMIEPIRELLETPIQTDRADTDERWVGALRGELLHAEVEMSGCLAEIKLTMRALSNLKPGDVIPVELTRAVAMHVEDVPLLRGVFGQSNGKYAVKVSELLRNQTGRQLVATTGVGR